MIIPNTYNAMKKLLYLLPALLLLLCSCTEPEYKTYKVAGLQFEYPSDFKVEIDEADEDEGVWQLVVYKDDNDLDFARVLIFKYDPEMVASLGHDEIMDNLHNICMQMCNNMINDEDYEVSDLSDLSDAENGDPNTWCFFTAELDGEEVTGMITSAMLGEYNISTFCCGHDQESGSKMVHVDSSMRKL